MTDGRNVSKRSGQPTRINSKMSNAWANKERQKVGQRKK